MENIVFLTHKTAYSRLNKDDLFFRVGPGEYVIKIKFFYENMIDTITVQHISFWKDLAQQQVIYGCQIFFGSFDHETKRTKNTMITLKTVERLSFTPCCIFNQKENQSTGSISLTNLPTQSVSPDG
jgi:hypothetical protein